MATAARSSDPDGTLPELVEGRHPALTAEVSGGELEITGRLLQASNATFVAMLRSADSELQCVYKPIKGEKPLWDFPQHTLAMREVAAYQISAVAGFDLVPVTVLVDGPAGTGSLQVWVDTEPDDNEQLVDLVPSAHLPKAGYFDVIEGLDANDHPVSVIHADHAGLRLMAAFDVLINNADRKGGHILASGGDVFGVDHGVTFNTEPKLRTLLWGWAGKPLEPFEVECVTKAIDLGPGVLTDLLADDEIEAFLDRGARLLASGRLPRPSGEWPSVPWPPF